MTRPNNDIERVVDSAADVLKALKRLDAELEQLRDGGNPYIDSGEKGRIDCYRFQVDLSARRISDIRGWSASLHEAAARIEEEERETSEREFAG